MPQRQDSNRSLLARSFSRPSSILRRDGRDEAPREPPKGPLRLTSLHLPEIDHPIADIVFVHGLNGGSYSTWTFDGDPAKFWPKEWLAVDEVFRDARIHTFGYESSISKQSILNIDDFARALAYSLCHCPKIPLGEKAPVILIGHSMGGLVIKRAYILSCALPELRSLSERILALFFLGTPHQGADIAKTLERLLSLAGHRPFVADLIPKSPMIQTINQEFLRVCSPLKLYSFFESKPMSYGLGRSLIVDKEAAVLGYPNERNENLDANHRDIARFPSPNDPSYITIRNALASCIREEVQFATEAHGGPEGRQSKFGQSRADLLQNVAYFPTSPRPNVSANGLTTHVEEDAHTEIEEHGIAAGHQRKIRWFLGVQDVPGEELINDLRQVPGTCQWLLQKGTFCKWRDGDDAPKIYWLTGSPGAGKSTISSFVVQHLNNIGRDCCYFFFSNGDKTRDNINWLLRSMAFQMAMIHPEIAEVILHIASESPVDRVDYRPVWRKIFAGGILKFLPIREQYWVIDAVGECKLAEELIGLLFHATRDWPLRIFVTSRPPEVSFHRAYNTKIISEKISEEDTNSDIALFLQAQLGGCQHTAEAMAALVGQVIKKSNGCFLWAYLVQQDLRSAHTRTSVDKVLQSTPSDMTQLYESILKKMEDSPDQNRKETEALLHWVVCACRPLTTDELKSATEADLKDEINDMETLVADRCGNLVVVDSTKRVKLVHQTIREVLTSKTLDSPFRVDLGIGHRRLAILQLQHLCGDKHAQNSNRGPGGSGTRSAHKRRPTTRAAQASAHLEQSQLARYAAGHVFQHIAKIPSSLCDDDVFKSLANFFSSSGVLWWIEHIARHDSLQNIFSAGKTVASVVNRRKQRSPPPLHIHKEIALLERWSNDLLRLVPKFGRRLRASPSSIDMIPPFCPPASAIREQFCLPRKGLSVQGLSSRDWDDCIATITFERQTRPSCVAVSDNYIAYGAPNGKIYIYEDGTFQERRVLAHGEQYVWCLAFGAGGAYLASATADDLVLWRTDTWVQIQKILLPSECMGITFTEDGDVVRAGLRTNEVLSWDVNDGMPNDEEDELVNWTVGLEEEMGDISQRQPSLVAFCPHRPLMAAVYRRTHILLWDLEYSQLEDLYVKGLGSTSKLGQNQAWGYGEDGYESPGAADSTKPSLITHGATGTETAYDIAFSSAPDSALMVVTYGGGDLCIYDIEKGVVLATHPGVHAHRVAITPDGRTVATAGPQGSMRLFDAGSLKCLYHVQLDGHAVNANSLTFTADGLKLIEVRGRQSRVWSPSVLLRQDAEEDVSDTVSLSTPMQEVDYNVAEPAVTALHCAFSSASTFVFLGRDDGTVLVQDMAGDEPLQLPLFTMPREAPVLSMHYDDETGLLSTGSTTCVVCYKITKPARFKYGKWGAHHTLTQAESSSVIHQVLGSGIHSRLLVSGEEGDVLWSFNNGSPNHKSTIGDDSMIGKRATETEQRNYRAKRWASHPTQRSLLILAEGATIEIRYWATFATVVSWKVDVGTAHMTRLLCHDDPTMPFFLTVGEEGEGGGSRRRSVGAADMNRRTIQVWSLQDLVEPSPRVSSSPPSPLTDYRPRPICAIDAREIDLGEVIGFPLGYLVYLNTDYYVCSLPIHPLASSTNDGQAARRRSSSSLLPPDSPLSSGFRGGSHAGNTANTGRTSNSTFSDTITVGDTSLAAAEGAPSEGGASADDRTRPTAHFFLPHDWVGLATRIDVDINRHGEVFFAKRGDVAVVKRGLPPLKEGARLDYRRSSSPGSTRFSPRPSPWPPGRGLQPH
ncbi:hypothetical protein MAPG_05077 [Magnaporthiopsis poae ATCC 64411]|uniref:GPI inositol-deacylase n=1 Tax=Magnaporthiopsis poae (strain ATCC 64411 / 73-15) TaxID=644358 RepID=A0A0C4DYF6_MAGP6|nr:hypothetical protein MAPG_05077 [Magnaporthiopsis poae ATCC 64411]